MDAALKNVTARGNSYRFKEKTACYPFVIIQKLSQNHSKLLTILLCSYEPCPEI